MPFTTVLIWVLPILSLALTVLVIYNQACQRRSFDKLIGQLEERSRHQDLNLQDIKHQSMQLKEIMREELHQYRQTFDKHQFETLYALQAIAVSLPNLYQKFKCVWCKRALY